MSQEKDKGDAILEGQELGIERGKKENVTLHTHFEYDDALIDDTERMSRQLAGQRKDLSQGDAREGVETRLRSAPAEPRFNVTSPPPSRPLHLADPCECRSCPPLRAERRTFRTPSLEGT
jgi:hypothetical protein